MNKHIFSPFIILFIIGCSHKVTFTDVQSSLHPQSSKEKELIRRFKEYWHARVNGQYNISYNYELPYQQYTINFDKYRKTLGLYRNSKISLLKLEYPQKNIAIIIRKMDGKKNSWIKKDKWIYLDGKWYHKYYQTLFPPLNEKEAQFQ